MPTSRQRLLESVQTRKIVSAGELSRMLQMTEANARHHLAILQEQGLVTIVGERPPRGKGRPTLLFGPAQQFLGHNLDGLAKALLKEMAGEEWVEKAAKSMAARDGETSPPQPSVPRSTVHLTQRLMQGVQRLNEMHYQARWEAYAGGPRLILGSCPYAAIIDAHPELCRVDAALLEELAGAPVEQIAKLARDRQGTTFCSFHIFERRRAAKDSQGMDSPG